MSISVNRQMNQQRRCGNSKILPHREDEPPTSPTTCMPRAAAHRSPRLLQEGSRPRLRSPRLMVLRTCAPPTPSSLARGHHSSTTSSQRPRCRGLNTMSRARHLGRSWWKGGLTLGGRRGHISTRAARRRLLLTAHTVSALRPLGNPPRATRKRCLAVVLPGPGRGGPPSPRSRHHHRCLHQGSPPQAPRHASPWLDAPRAPNARGSSSSPSSLCLAQICASQ